MRPRARNFAFFLLVAIGAASQCAQATKLTVNCDNHEPIRTALRPACNYQSARTEHDHCFGRVQRKHRD